MADGLEMGGNEILKLLIEHGADLATIKTTVNRLDTLIGNGGGLVRRVEANREVCDRREENHQKDRREVWDWIRTHKGKSMALAGGASGLVTAITKGIEQLWIVTHTPAAMGLHPAVFPVVGTVSFTVLVVTIMGGKSGKDKNADQ